jgi:O-antigen ligase
VGLLDSFLFPSKIGLFGNQFRQQGFFLFLHLLAFSVFAKKELLQKTPLWLLLSFLLLQVAGIFYFSPNAVGRAYGFLGEPNALAAVAVFSLPLLFLPQMRKQLLLPGILLCAIILFASGSRSGLVAAGIESAILLLAQKYQSKLRLIFYGCIVAYVLFILATLLLSSPQESRIEIWHAAFVGFLSHPLIGGGFGNIETTLHTSSQTFASFISARYVDSSHNIFLDMLLQTGILGFCAFSVLIFDSFKTFLRKKQIISLALFSGMLVVLSFNPGSVWELVVFWYFVGEGLSSSTA